MKRNSMNTQRTEEFVSTHLCITMKTALILFLFHSLLVGVFGVDVMVSVMEGDSVTLHTDKTIQSNDVIKWKFGDERIAEVNSGSSRMISEWVQPEGAFRDRIRLNNQTGDLKIRNITVTDSGEYKLEISTTEGPTSSKTFNVRVVDVNQKSSVLVGEFVTLSTGVTDTVTYDVIRWRFGGQSSPIAEVNRTNNKITLYDGPDGRFNGRLQLDYWTGSLTITNTRTDHTGHYEVDLMSSSRFTVHKSFTVTVSGEIKSLTVKEGESVDLKTDAVLQTHDSALWMFGDTVIVTIQNNIINAGLDEKFGDRLKLNNQTGSLTITNIKTTHSGHYQVTIISSKRSIHKKYNVIVTDSRLSVTAVVVISLIVAVFASAVTAGLIYCCKIRQKSNKNFKRCQQEEL